MPIFRVLLSGANMLMKLGGEPDWHGFRVARFVEAASEADAHERALALVRASPQLSRGTLNSPDDPPLCRVEAVQRLPAGAAMPATQPGFAFFPETPTEE